MAGQPCNGWAGACMNGTNFQQFDVTCSSRLQAFYEYGLFCLRTAARSQADTCLRQALSLNNKHSGGLQTLLCLSLHWLQSGEEENTERAEVLGHSLKDLQPNNSLPWALLSLVYRAGGKYGQDGMGKHLIWHGRNAGVCSLRAKARIHSQLPAVLVRSSWCESETLLPVLYGSP